MFFSALYYPWVGGSLEYWIIFHELIDTSDIKGVSFF